MYGTASPTSDFDLVAVTEDIDIPFIIKALNPQPSGDINEEPDKVDALYACFVNIIHANKAFKGTNTVHTIIPNIR